MVIEVKAYLWCWLQGWATEYGDPILKLIIFSPEFNE